MDILGRGDYTSLEAALAANEPNIKILNGTYAFSENVVVTTDNTHIIGESAENVKLIQTNPNKNLLVINANNVTIEKITLDTRTNNAQAAFVEEGYDNIILKDSIVRGGDKIFCIFFAGPDVTEGAETNAAYQASNLSNGNKITNNDISCDFSGDGATDGVQVAQNAINIQEPSQTGNQVINNIFNNYGGTWMHSPGTGIDNPNNSVTLSGNSNNENL